RMLPVAPAVATISTAAWVAPAGATASEGRAYQEVPGMAGVVPVGGPRSLSSVSYQRTGVVTVDQAAAPGWTTRLHRQLTPAVTGKRADRTTDVVAVVEVTASA